MAVISLSITESSKEVISGIPYQVTISANIPSTIFYTLDGSEPTTSSSVYVGSITLPTNNSSVTLKVFATNGTDTSAVITKLYGPALEENSIFRAQATNAPGSNYLNQFNQFPFGTGNVPVPNTYGDPAGITVDDPKHPNILDGYDGTGAQVRGSDKELSNYDFIYSETDSLNQRGPGIGTLPAQVKVKNTQPYPVSSSTSDKLFNPKALVIYQDSRDIDPNDPTAHLNRQFFALTDLNKTRNGSVIGVTEVTNNISGSFLRSHYNPRDNTITYYYRDKETNRWIISKEPYTPKNENIGALYKVVFSSREQGSGYVFKWTPFFYRRTI